MKASKLAHITDAALLRRISTLAARGRALTASLVAHLAEFDARKLYLPAGYSSMHAYCVEALHLSDDAAYRRIRAARATRQFPVIGRALADGRVHLATVSVLAPHLSSENVDELISTCTHRRKADVESMVALRFPGSGGSVAAIPRTTIRALPTTAIGLVPGRVPDAPLPELDLVSASTNAMNPVPGGMNPMPGGGNSSSSDSGEPAQAATTGSGLTTRALSGDTGTTTMPAPTLDPARMEPDHFILRVAISARTRRKLSHAHALLSHRVASGDVAQVIDRALDALIERLEKRKFAATDRPRPDRGVRNSQSGRDARTSASNGERRPTIRRRIPARVRRSVWRRDRGRCTFVGDEGHRCDERRRLEFDHVRAFAHGGLPVEDNLRLRCRAHNQLEADRSFGEEFMRTKRKEHAGMSQSAHGDMPAAGMGLATHVPNSA